MSGTGEIKVTFAALGTANADVAATAARITTQLEDLRRFLQPMVATWTGQAAQEYARRQRQWDTAAADLTAVLSRIASALGAANESYQQVERANAARWA